MRKFTTRRTEISHSLIWLGDEHIVTEKIQHMRQVNYTHFIHKLYNPQWEIKMKNK